MRKLLTIIACLAGVNNLQSQSLPPVAFSDLSTPSMPAFVIIDKSIEGIQRPSDLKSFSVSLLNSLNSDKSLNDIALETTPFWWKPKYNLDFDTYYRINTNSQLSDEIAQSFKETFSLSFASAEYTKTLDSTMARKMGVGVKFQLIRGKVSDTLLILRKMIAYDDFYRMLLGKLSREIDAKTISKPEILEKFKELLDKNKKSINLSYFNDLDKQRAIDYSEEEFNQWLNTLVDTIHCKEKILEERNRYNEQLTEQLSQVGDKRIGLIWEVAAATAIDFPTNMIDYSIADKTGIWTTITWRTANGKNDFILLLRGTNSLGPITSKSTDYGCRILHDFGNANVSFEAIYRNYQQEYETFDINNQKITALKKSETWRFSMLFQYKLSEQVNLSAAIGKDFDSPIVMKGNLLAMLGLNIAVPQKRTTVIKSNY